MRRVIRVFACGVCVLVAFAAAGCRANALLPLSDGGPTSGLSLSASPGSLVIRPSGSGHIQFVVRDGQNLPVAGAMVDFFIVSDTPDGGAAGAQLSTERGLTDGNGTVELEIIVGNLASDNSPAAFVLRASCLGSAPVQADILVTTNAYSVEILPVPNGDLLGAEPVASTRLFFYDNTTCAVLDLNNLNAAPNRPRTPHSVAVGLPWAFSGVAGQGDSAVVGLGMDSANIARIGGCVDVLGASLLESQAIQATLFMDHLFPVPLGSYQAVSSFEFAAPLSATVAIQSAWQQWTRCPLDPARLWLDCTIDALVSDSVTDPNDCIPVPGAEGMLGDVIFARRGTTVAPLKGTVVGTTDTACHDRTDSAGRTSLEVTVDALFNPSRARLTSTKLGALPSEIETILDSVRLDSGLTVTEAGTTNSYFISHGLTGLTFPDAPVPNSFKTSALGLPVTTASWILATLKRDQITIPEHGFTLRLGTSARYAFEASSLMPRGAQNASALVNFVFGLAQLNDRGTVLTGCAALDAAVCDGVNQPRSCVMSACQVGLDALASRLAGAFGALDGDGLDFFLSGLAPVVDLNGDGQVDALGIAGAAGAVGGGPGPGLWSAEIRGSAGSSVTYGSWSASRVPALP